MMSKRLQKDSEYDQYDMDGDGLISMDEFSEMMEMDDDHDDHDDNDE